MHTHEKKSAPPMNAELDYLTIAKEILTEGEYVKPDNEEGRYQTFSQVIECPLHGHYVPVLTTKFVSWKWAFREMMWFLTGSQNIQYLKDRKVNIWDIWADSDNNVGPLYGFLMRYWPVQNSMTHEFNGVEYIDQIANVIKSLRDRPEARSHIVSMWRPDLGPAQAIKPCPVFLQFYRVRDEVSLSVYQRSCDFFLGVPFNLAQYAFLLHLIARQIGCKAQHMTWHGGDVHIYENHVGQIKTQLFESVGAAPEIVFQRSADTIEDISEYEVPRDVNLYGYEHGPRLSGDISPQGTPGQVSVL